MSTMPEALKVELLARCRCRLPLSLLPIAEQPVGRRDSEEDTRDEPATDSFEILHDELKFPNNFPQRDG
jgi:hypothetical protein